MDSLKTFAGARAVTRIITDFDIPGDSLIFTLIMRISASKKKIKF